MKAKFNGKWYRVHPYANGNDFLIEELGKAYPKEEFEYLENEQRWSKYPQAKPPLYKRVLGFNRDWISDDNPEGIMMGYESEKGFVLSDFWNSHYMVIRKKGSQWVITHPTFKATSPEYWIALDSLTYQLPLDKLK